MGNILINRFRMDQFFITVQKQWTINLRKNLLKFNAVSGFKIQILDCDYQVQSSRNCDPLSYKFFAYTLIHPNRKFCWNGSLISRGWSYATRSIKTNYQAWSVIWSTEISLGKIFTFQKFSEQFIFATEMDKTWPNFFINGIFQAWCKVVYFEW